MRSIRSSIRSTGYIALSGLTHLGLVGQRGLGVEENQCFANNSNSSSSSSSGHSSSISFSSSNSSAAVIVMIVVELY